jgi:dTDP-4-dehydrorhamnose reductase
MRVLILGGSGMLGHKLVQVLSEDLDVYSTIRTPFSDVAGIDIFDRDQTLTGFDAMRESHIREAIEACSPDVLINAIGVVKQSPDSVNIAQTVILNAILPHMCAKLAQEKGFRFITISTDCVFSGKRGNYNEEDEPDAEDLYGLTKHWGEVSGENCLSLRTSMIGRELSRTQGLIEWFLSNRGKTVSGYSSAIFSGFPTIVLADIIKRLIAEHDGLSGVYHVSSEPISKYDVLCLANESFGVDVEIISSDELVIDRSLDSERFRHVTGFSPLPWPEMIEIMASDPTPYNKWRI